MKVRFDRPILGTLAVALAVLATTAAAAPSATLVQQVRDAAWRYRDPLVATADGYALASGCVSDEQRGAMGVHYVRGDLLADGALDAAHPEALVYEPMADGSLRLVAVEFITIADAWNAVHEAPPLLVGQQFFYEDAPNRYGIPAVYELHVWAFARNPNGMFAAWNPTVSCENYIPPA